MGWTQTYCTIRVSSFSLWLLRVIFSRGSWGTVSTSHWLVSFVEEMSSCWNSFLSLEKSASSQVCSSLDSFSWLFSCLWSTVSDSLSLRSWRYVWFSLKENTNKLMFVLLYSGGRGIQNFYLSTSCNTTWLKYYLTIKSSEFKIKSKYKVFAWKNTERYNIKKHSLCRTDLFRIIHMFYNSIKIIIITKKWCLNQCALSLNLQSHIITYYFVNISYNNQ